MKVLKVPGLNNCGKNDGSRNSGEAILKELENIWTSEKGKPIDRNLLEIEEIIVNNSNLKEQEQLIYEKAKEEISNNGKVIFLGGDHSISYPIGKAFLDLCDENKEKACLIVFDAHPDCMLATKTVTHEEWLRGLIDVGFPRENILLIGARNSEQEEVEFLARNKIRQISMNALNENLQDSADIITEFAHDKQLYVSFDIDVVDPAFAPSTGYPEPGGLTSRQSIYLIQRIGLMKNLKAIDLVEIDCETNEKMTVKLGAKILGELL